MILRLLYPFAKIWWRLFPKVALGTRVFVVDKGRVLLVKMTYLRDWYFPGGGVDQHETLKACAERELLEETGYRCDEIAFRSMYFDNRERASNHVALFMASGARAIEGARPDREIAQVKWFDLRELPADVSPATRRRINEYLGGQPPSETW